jgi:hypothetical protein
VSKTFRKILRTNHERIISRNEEIVPMRNLRKIRRKEEKDKMIESKFIKKRKFKLRYDGKIFKEDNVEIPEEVQEPGIITPIELYR